MNQPWADAERRWSEAADLLRSAGRTPVDMRDWLGTGWSGRAADGFGEWSRTFEEATRRAAGALNDAAATAGVQASGGKHAPVHVDRLEATARGVADVVVPGQRSSPRPRKAVPEKPQKPVPQKPRKPSASGRVPKGRQPPAQVRRWIDEAVAILRENGYRADQTDPGAIAKIIHHESGGDPSAVNRHDSNAARGTPSMGLMQTIGPTFERYHLPGHDKILNPVDNIIAAVRYAVARYGSVSRVPGVASLEAGNGYRGY